MIVEHAVFWRDFFFEIRRQLPVGDTLDSEGQNLGVAAATVIIRELFPEISQEDFSMLFRLSPIPGFEPIKSYPDDLANHAQIEFEKAGLTPTAFDVAAILFETTGIEIPRNAEIDIENRDLAMALTSSGLYYANIRLSIDALSYKDSPELKGRLKLAVNEISKFVEGERERFNQDLVAKLEEQKTAVLKEIENTKNDIINDLQSNGAKHTDSANTELRKVHEMGETMLERIQTEGSSMLDQKKNELVENLILQDVMELWDEKADNHKRWFQIGAILFFGMIAVPILAGIVNFDAVTAVVKSMLPAGSTLPWGSLLVFTLPALGYAWILRLVSRFTLQNLTLADDAAQRSVMAKTFIRLAAEEKVHDEKDRAIMLNALFRPIPGAKEQDLQPPTIADFVSKQS
ncbi:DUF6161 domain-containing protein [uncultured Roseibium sp.]|uniref:DUF6161 domain-containing protein n=1 Tax=uncultured Roseibium sp. TaxID=1936171 RepID=UPI0026044E54|nr:DUF6161 domain-containing protein [uncultured Roseibium sp.]